MREPIPPLYPSILPYGADKSIQSFVLNWMQQPYDHTDNIRFLRHILHSGRYQVFSIIVYAP
jgi:hypothetical protein